MRILCDLTILNNSQPGVSVKHTKATVAISVQPPDKELYLIIFTNKNKHQSTQKYRIQENLAKVFNRFADEGKLTLAFKEPNQSLQIKTDPLQLKAFLSTLKLALNCSKDERNKIGLSSIGVTAIAAKARPVTKLSIYNRGDFPTKGLPRTLIELTISGIGRCRIDMQIVYLKQLQILDVSDNCITKVPKPIGDLNLKELNLSKNDLGNPENGCDWKWLKGENLQRSLRVLHIAENKLPGIPVEIFKFRNLVTLQLSNNHIKRVPFAIRKLNYLKNLLLSSNQLESLPSILEMIRLDVVNISGNPFNGNIPHSQPGGNTQGAPTFPSLFEIAARFVELNRIPYSRSSIPYDVMDLLFYTPVCRCGRICFHSELHAKQTRINFNASSVIIDFPLIHLEYVFCSVKCQSLIRRH